MPTHDSSQDRAEPDPLSEILHKIVVYQHSLPDGRAVELEELREKQILSLADFEFISSHSVTYEPRRRNSFQGMSLSIPTEKGCRIVGLSGRRPKRRTAPLREFQSIVENFLKLPPTDEGSGLLVHISTYDGASVDPKYIYLNFRDPQLQLRAPTIREVAIEHGLVPREHKEAQGPLHVNFVVTPDTGHTAAGFVDLLRRGCGLSDEAEITYSAAALDLREPDFSPDVPSDDGVFQDKTHAFIYLCLQTAQKHKGARSGHVSALEVLAVAGEVARTFFGANAAAILRSEGIDSSASLGKALYRMIEQEILFAADGDKVSDFNVRSSFDDLFEAH